jgi:hypothetical protein
MILTRESGAQEDQFDGKKRRPKISWYYPFKAIMEHTPEPGFLTKSVWYICIYFNPCET